MLNEGTAFVSLSSPTGGEGRGEEVDCSQIQIPSPRPSPRLGGEREPKLRLSSYRRIKMKSCFSRLQLLKFRDDFFKLADD